MDVILKTYLPQKKIKFLLVFFCFIFLISCQQKKETPELTIKHNEKQQAVKVSFTGDGDIDSYALRLKGSENSILGKAVIDGKNKTFVPIIPFTGGETYQILKEGRLHLEFNVPKAENQQPPKLLGIYPKLQTLPENLLKMYFVFDTPMQQSQSTLKFIKVFEKESGSEVDIFLPLENELWNAERTQLTLWLDPGRIKKDLIPNKEKGIPIKEGNSYEIVIDSTLQNHNGIALGKQYTKRFLVGKRDQEIPSISQSDITPPEASTGQGLGIRFSESLDYLSIPGMIRIYNDDDKLVAGSFLTSKKATSTLFVPKKKWKKGSYTIVIDSKLEDLAGNNFNRLFDTDLHKKRLLKPTKTKRIPFVVK